MEQAAREWKDLKYEEQYEIYDAVRNLYEKTVGKLNEENTTNIDEIFKPPVKKFTTVNETVANLKTGALY